MLNDIYVHEVGNSANQDIESLDGDEHVHWESHLEVAYDVHGGGESKGLSTTLDQLVTTQYARSLESSQIHGTETESLKNGLIEFSGTHASELVDESPEEQLGHRTELHSKLVETTLALEAKELAASALQTELSNSNLNMKEAQGQLVKLWQSLEEKAEELQEFKEYFTRYKSMVEGLILEKDNEVVRLSQRIEEWSCAGNNGSAMDLNSSKAQKELVILQEALFIAQKDSEISKEAFYEYKSSIEKIMEEKDIQIEKITEKLVNVERRNQDESLSFHANFLNASEVHEQLEKVDAELFVFKEENLVLRTEVGHLTKTIEIERVRNVKLENEIGSKNELLRKIEKLLEAVQHENEILLDEHSRLLQSIQKKTVHGGEVLQEDIATVRDMYGNDPHVLHSKIASISKEIEVAFDMLEAEKGNSKTMLDEIIENHQGELGGLHHMLGEKDSEILTKSNELAETVEKLRALEEEWLRLQSENGLLRKHIRGMSL